MDKLRFAVRQFGPFEQALQSCWQAYKIEHPSTLELEFVSLDLEQLYAALFLQKGLHNGDWDIVHINTDWIAKAYEEQGLHILNDFIAQEASRTFADAWSPSLLNFQNFDGQIVGLPFHDGPECLVFRKDLFEQPLEQSNFLAKYHRELEVPRSWSDFLEVAAFFTRPDQNLYGTIFAGYPDGHNAVFDFCIQLWSRGGELLDASGKIAINQALAIESLDFYRHLFKTQGILHPKSSEFESVQAGAAFANGEVAMMVNWFGFASWAHIDTQSQVKGCVDIAAIPAAAGLPSPSLNVYWLYAIAKGSNIKEQAFDFLKFAVSQEQDKLLTRSGGVGCRYTTWDDVAIKEEIPFYGKLSSLHETARTLPRMARWPEIAHIIDEAVSQSIRTDIPSATLLTEAQQKINKLS